MAIEQNDATPENTNVSWSEDDAADELLKQFLPKDEDAATPSDEGKEDQRDEQPEPKADAEDDAQEEPASEEEEEGEKAIADEGAYVKIKVGDEDHEVPVKDLMRLYGQEKALTQKSMEVADQRKQYENTLAQQAATTTAILKRAQERWAPYSKLDFNLLAAKVGTGELSTDEYQALRQSAQAAYEDVEFLGQHAQAFMQAIAQEQATKVQNEAREALKVLSGPAENGGIEGWSEQLYNDIRTFAQQQGAPAEVVNTITQPWAIRMMHSAMLYERGKSKGAVKTVKVAKGPKKIVKTTNSPASTKGDAKAGSVNKAMKNLKQFGSVDDAAEALLARWGAEEE